MSPLTSNSTRRWRRSTLVAGLLLATSITGIAPASASTSGLDDITVEGTAAPVAAATLNTPRYFTEIERDAYDAINIQRTERGLSALELDVTTDGSLPVVEQQWRDCFMRLNTTGITHDPYKTCQTNKSYDYETEQILTLMWSDQTSAPNASVNPNTYKAVSAWQASPPHMEWLTATDATAVRVYAGCISTGSKTYLIIAATLLDKHGEWPTPNKSYSRANVATSSDANSKFNPANYSSCDSSGGASPIVGGLTATHSLWRAAATRNPGLTNLTMNEPWNWSPFQISRLYSAYFNRNPDGSGFTYWMEQAKYNRTTNRSVTLSEISQYFTASDEFVQTYGNAMSHEAFLRLVYQNVLDRSPDAEGTAYWLNLMNHGLSRGDVMVWFSESAEYINNTGAAVTGSCWKAGDPKSSYLCAAAKIPSLA
ncbi:MAG: DUF4214 domain-containing protein [Acidimicrobiales bacterium]